MVDLEQFREAVKCWRRSAAACGSSDDVKDADRLLSIIDSAGKVASAGLRVVLLGDAVAALSALDDGESFSKVANALDGMAFRVPAAPRQPAPVVDDAMRWLIDAATDAHDFAVNTARNDGKELDRRFYRLRAALARAQGVGNG